jgi:hypothetical protein
MAEPMKKRIIIATFIGLCVIAGLFVLDIPLVYVLGAGILVIVILMAVHSDLMDQWKRNK